MRTGQAESTSRRWLRDMPNVASRSMISRVDVEGLLGHGRTKQESEYKPEFVPVVTIRTLHQSESAQSCRTLSAALRVSDAPGPNFGTERFCEMKNLAQRYRLSRWHPLRWHFVIFIPFVVSRALSSSRALRILAVSPNTIYDTAFQSKTQ